MRLRVCGLSQVTPVVLMTLAGCIPQPVEWLPDSSGFITPNSRQGRGEVIYRFDVTRRAMHKVMKFPDGVHSTNPALSPDGSRFAALWLTTVRGEGIARIVFYDLSGERLDTSRKIPLSTAKPPERRIPIDGVPVGAPTLLAWTPDGKAIRFCGDGICGTYDLTTDTITTHDLPSDVSVTFALLLIRRTPIAHDASGFLAVRDRAVPGAPRSFEIADDIDQLVAVDWDGNVHEFAKSPAVTKAIQRAIADFDDVWMKMHTPVQTAISLDELRRWNGGTLMVPIYGGEIQIDLPA